MGSEFKNAEDLKPIISRLISGDKDVRFSHLQSDMIVLRRRFGEKAVKWIARIKLVPNEFKYLFPDNAVYLLDVDADQFDFLEDEQKEAILYHELLHTHRNEKGKYKLVQHDIQEFNAVIEKYGPYLSDVSRTFGSVEKYKANNSPENMDGGSGFDLEEELSLLS